MTPFFRVDNRLIHGQIIATWMPHLRLRRIVIASDTVPDNQLQQEMFHMAMPPDVEFAAMRLSDMVRWLCGRGHGHASTMVLLETVEDAVRVFDGGFPFSELNIGNLHHAPDRRCFTNAVFLGPEDLELIDELGRRGVRVFIQSLPSETPIDVSAARTGGAS